MPRLITVTDRTLKAAGLARDEATAASGFRAFCQTWREQHPDEEEPDFVHLRLEIWDDEIGPVVALGDSVDGSGPTPRPAISLCLTTAPSDSTSAGRVNAGVDGLPEHQVHRPDAHRVYTPSLPATAEEIDAARASLQRWRDTLAMSAATLGLKDGTYGRPWWRSGSERI